MKFNSLISIALCLAAGTAAASTPHPLNSEDCHVYAHDQVYRRDVYGFWGWVTYSVALSAHMQLQSEQAYRFANNPLAIQASLDVEGQQARVRFVAPGVREEQVLPISYDDQGVGTVQYLTEYHNRWTKKGMLYRVECSLGLHSVVADINANDEAEMNRLGPALAWPDANAPSLAQLPVGTVLELTRDLEIHPGTETAQTTFVEQNGLMSTGEFWALRLPFRFAFAEFFNANNGYIETTHYAKGLRLQVVSVTRQEFSSGGHEYNIKFRTLDSAGSRTQDPITWMKVDGRRSGRADIVIPQFEQLVAPAFKVVLP